MKCFEYQKKCNLLCEKKGCRYWIKNKQNNNCCINAASAVDEEKFTLQDIGDIFSVTRMRICQIEKKAIKKLKDKLNLIFPE